MPGPPLIEGLARYPRNVFFHRNSKDFGFYFDAAGVVVYDFCTA